MRTIKRHLWARVNYHGHVEHQWTVEGTYGPAPGGWTLLGDSDDADAARGALEALWAEEQAAAEEARAEEERAIRREARAARAAGRRALKRMEVRG